MARGFKERRKWLFSFNVRWMERNLSVRNLHRILKVHACVRAALRRNPASVPLPACLGVAKSVRGSRVQGYLNQMLEYLPDRLAEPKWMSRCSIEGLDRVLLARQEGRPVVLAFFHSSAFRLSRFWLRAAGIPAAILITGKAENRTKFDRFGDRLSPFPEVPTAFYLDQLRQVSEFLAAGNSLLIAIDHAKGKLMNVPVCEGWTFQMPTGPVRLSIRHRAELIPFVLIDEGRWRFQIKLGRPVPAEYLADEADWIHAGKHLLDEMLPHFRNHPDQCSKLLVKNFQSAGPATPDGKFAG